jgi:hypothetical protein
LRLNATDSSKTWTRSAAKNLVDLSACLIDCECGLVYALQDDDVSWIATNVRNLFTDKTAFNEWVRTCPGIPGDLKLWIVVP